MPFYFTLLPLFTTQPTLRAVSSNIYGRPPCSVLRLHGGPFGARRVLLAAMKLRARQFGGCGRGGVVQALECGEPHLDVQRGAEVQLVLVHLETGVVQVDVGALRGVAYAEE